MKAQIQTRQFFGSVAALVVPMALQNLIDVAVQGADVVMLGRVGQIQLGAASLAGQIQFVMMLIIFGLGSGASVLTAQYWGRGDVRTIEKVAAIALRLSMSVAVIFFLAAELLPGQLMGIFTPDKALIREGVKYLRYAAPGYLMMGFSNLYFNIMRSMERLVISTVCYCVALVVNVGLNAVLIFGYLGFPALGIEGAALATTIARAVVLVITAVYAARNGTVRLRLRDFVGRHPVLMRDFFKYAGPTTLNEMLWGMAISASAVIIGNLGADAVAANAAAQVARQLAIVLAMGVASATAVMVGKALGANDAARAEGYAARLLGLAAATGLLGSAVIIAVRPAVVQGIKLTDAARELLWFQLLAMSLYVIGQAVNATLIVGVCRAGGDTRFGLFLDITSMWFVSLPAAAAAAFVLHAPVKAVLALILMDEFIKLPVCIWRYRSKKWLRNVTRG